MNDYLRNALQLSYFEGPVLHLHELNAILSADHGKFVHDQGLVLHKFTSILQWKGDFHQEVAVFVQGIGWRIWGHWRTFCHWEWPFIATTDKGIPRYLPSICSIIYWVLFWCVTLFTCTRDTTRAQSGVLFDPLINILTFWNWMAIYEWWIKNRFQKDMFNRDWTTCPN